MHGAGAVQGTLEAAAGAWSLTQTRAGTQAGGILRGGWLMSSTLINDLLDVLDRLSGGGHAGFRPVHARGTMYAGTFVPAPTAAGLTRAPHATHASTPVTVRFSIASGIPTVADNDPHESSPQAMAIRFHLADHVHTDLINHSHNGFPARTGEEVLALFRAVAASGPGAPTPPPIVGFLASHPAAKAFVEAPKPIPSSFARQAYFGVTAFQFTNASGVSRFGRFRVRPAAGTEFLTPEQAATKTSNFLAAELSERLTKGPVRFHLLVQMAADGDDVTDATKVWPESRENVEFGTISLTERVDELAPERRKIIFDPVPRVDGIDPSGDPLIDVRSELYLVSGRRRRAAEV